MYALLTIVFFIAALLSNGDPQLVIGYSIVAALFAIAAAISSIYTLMSNKQTDKKQEEKK